MSERRSESRLTTESSYVEVAVPSIDIDEQIQVTIPASLTASHRAEDPDVAHAELLA